MRRTIHSPTPPRKVRASLLVRGTWAFLGGAGVAGICMILMWVMAAALVDRSRPRTVSPEPVSFADHSLADQIWILSSIPGAFALLFLALAGILAGIRRLLER